MRIKRYKSGGFWFFITKPLPFLPIYFINAECVYTGATFPGFAVGLESANRKCLELEEWLTAIY